MAFAGLVIAPLALLGFGTYFAVARPAALLLLALALQGTFVIMMFGELGRSLLRRRPLGDPIQLIRQLGLLAGVVIALLSDIGQQQRWRGPFGAARAAVPARTCWSCSLAGKAASAA